MWSRVVVAERLVYRKKVVEKGSKHECWVIGIGRELPKKVGHMNLAGKVHGDWGVLVFGFLTLVLWLVWGFPSVLEDLRLYHAK